VRRAFANVLFAVLWTLFVIASVHTWTHTHRPTGLSMAIVELVAASLFLIRRDPVGTYAPLPDWIVGLIGTMGALFLRPDNTQSGALGDALLGVQFAGALVAALCLLSLGRSFGVVPANRGVRTAGPYSIVRHPVYACYGVILLAYLGENPSWRNLIVVVGTATAQLARIRAEERYLRRDPVYSSYASRVRWRLVPHLY
jgi:protein-S-isoprenylcysteine O-methyltransferase Ste14